MALKDIQTQILTQAPGAGGTLIDYIAASLRVYDTTKPSAIAQIGGVAVSLGPQCAVVLSSDGRTVFIVNGLSFGILYSVSVVEPSSPVVLDSLLI